MRFTIILMFICVPLLFAQTQEWVERYDGPVNVVDGGTSIAVDINGNVYVTGRRGDTPASFECTTIKYDAVGTEKWVATYRIANSNYYDTGWGIALDDFGFVYVTAASTDSLTGDDIAVIKYDTLGNFIWDARYNGPGDDYDWPFDIEVDQSSNVYVTGRSVGAGTGFDYVTVKWDSAGVEQWVGRYNGTANATDEAYSIAVDNSGNVYTTGTSTGSGTGLDFATVKYDSSGNEIWARRYHTTGDMDEFGTTLDIDSAGNVYITGGSWKFMQGIPSDIITVKYNADGDTIWSVRYNGTGNDDDIPEEIAIDRFANIYIAGDSWTSGAARTDYTVIKYDTLGNEKWVRKYNGPVSNNDNTRAIAVDIHGSVYVTGVSRGAVDDDYASVVWDSAGTQITVQRYDGPGTWADAAQDIIADAHGNFYITGFSGGAGTTYDFATIKYSGIPGIRHTPNREIVLPMLCPTILTGPLNLPKDKKCKVYDITGREVGMTILASGIYFIEIDNKIVQKIIKIR